MPPTATAYRCIPMSPLGGAFTLVAYPSPGKPYPSSSYNSQQKKRAPLRGARRSSIRPAYLPLGLPLDLLGGLLPRLLLGGLPISFTEASIALANSCADCSEVSRRMSVGRRIFRTSELSFLVTAKSLNSSSGRANKRWASTSKDAWSAKTFICKPVSMPLTTSRKG